MKIKYALIYGVIGAAFLAVSLWVILSGGKSARALRTKYRLGGILLATWAMLSASSCNGVFPVVTCYDPVMPENIVMVGKTTVVRGEALTVSIEYPMYPVYGWYLLENKQMDSGILQEGRFTVPEEYDGKVDFQLVPSKELAPGTVTLSIVGIYTDEDGTENSFGVYTQELILQ